MISFTKKSKRKAILPGFAPSFAFSVIYLSLIILIPLGVLILKSMNMTFSRFWEIATSERVLAAFKISFGLSILASFASLFFGLIIAWVLVRYQFPGRKLLDAVIDLPFAMPTAVSGITLATLYAKNGWLGYPLSLIGIDAAFTPLGIFIALLFIGFPFIVRAVEPALQDMDRELEEAAASLGASRRVIVSRVIIPYLAPSLLTGFSMCLARVLGEYGSVIFIAGNLPFVSEILPLLIVIKLEQFDYEGATVIAVSMLSVAFLMLLCINLFQSLLQKRWTGEFA